MRKFLREVNCSGLLKKEEYNVLNVKIWKRISMFWQMQQMIETKNNLQEV